MDVTTKTICTSSESVLRLFTSILYIASLNHLQGGCLGDHWPKVPSSWLLCRYHMLFSEQSWVQLSIAVSHRTLSGSSHVSHGRYASIKISTEVTVSLVLMRVQKPRQRQKRAKREPDANQRLVLHSHCIFPFVTLTLYVFPYVTRDRHFVFSCFVSHPS